MAAKLTLVLCAQALLIQCALSQLIGRGPGVAPYVPYDALGYGPGCGCGGIASSGGGFPVTSVSPIAPTGLSIVSENAFEGALLVGGAAPFLSAVALEGVLPTVGAGAVSYGCGNGAVGITSESPIATGIVGPGPAYGPGLPAGPVYAPGLPAGPVYAPGLAAPGPLYGPGLGYPGIGCGL